MAKIMNMTGSSSTVRPFSEDPVHDIFHSVLIFTTTVDLLLQLYTMYIIWRVSTPQIKTYRYFMLFSVVSSGDGKCCDC